MPNNRRGMRGGGRSYFNPWEGGNVPGNTGGGMSYGSSGNQSHLLSQLSEPQAQLALALTKLLQPQQSQVPPSLMSMDVMGRSANFGGRNFGGQRGVRPDMNRRPRHDLNRGLFNKNQTQTGNHNRGRGVDFKHRSNFGGGNKQKVQPNRTPIVQKVTKPFSATKPSKTSKPSGPAGDSKSVAEDKKDATIKQEKDNDIKSEGSEEEDKKDEKTEEPTEGDEENDAEKEENDNEEDGKDETEKTEQSAKNISGKYTGIPVALLQCKICRKKMWDGLSYEKHMNGRAHQQMYEKVEESYRIKADMMRESIRLAEEKNNIEIDRMKRLGKKMKTQKNNRCAMCNLEFKGFLFVHRKSDGHQKLKKFLHPRCNYCAKEFPTRMEWETHRHSLEHFTKKAEKHNKNKEKLREGEVTVDNTIDITMEDLDMQQDDVESSDNLILDVVEDYSQSWTIPKYRTNREVGVSFIREVQGFYCDICPRFFLTKENSEKHARTEGHYENFVKLINENIFKAEAEKRKLEENGEEENDDDNEGNWKRRKVSKDENDDENAEEEEDEKKKEASEEDANGTGEDLYDPADSFVGSDPNDVVLNEDKSEIKPEDKSAIEAKQNEDELWEDVDKKIDEILLEKREMEEAEKAQPVVEPKEEIKPPPVVAPKPSPAKRGTGTARRARGRK